MAANQSGVVISRKLQNISSKFQRLLLCFRGQPFYSSGTFDFVGRRCVLEIQDDSQITGSSNHQNSNGEPTAIDHGKLAGSVPRRFQ